MLQKYLWNVKCFFLPLPQVLHGQTSPVKQTARIKREMSAGPIYLAAFFFFFFFFLASPSSSSAGASSTGAGAGSSAFGSSLTATKRPMTSLDVINLSLGHLVSPGHESMLEHLGVNLSLLVVGL